MRRYALIPATLTAVALAVAAPVVHAAPVAAAPAAPTPAWGDSFTADAVGTYLGDKKANVLVVGATAVSEPAAEALRGAMRASKRAGLVMDAQAIGVTEGLDDRTIVDRAKTQPVGQIVIVRVFDGGPGEPPSAIVTFYKPDGAVATAITATAGTAIASNGVAASAGVSSETVDAVESVNDEVKTETKKQDKVDRAAQAKYDAEYLWFENWVGVNQHGAVVARWSNIKQGKYGNDVRGSSLYKITGRDDLLKRYRTRLGIRLGVGIPVSVGGFAMMMVGLAALFRSVGPTGPDFGFDDPIGPREQLGQAQHVARVGIAAQNAPRVIDLPAHGLDRPVGSTEQAQGIACAGEHEGRCAVDDCSLRIEHSPLAADTIYRGDRRAPAPRSPRGPGPTPLLPARTRCRRATAARRPPTAPPSVFIRRTSPSNGWCCPGCSPCTRSNNSPVRPVPNWRSSPLYS